MITIQIDGPRGEGSTTVAIVLARHLHKLGYDVKYRGFNKFAGLDVEEQIAMRKGPCVFKKKRVQIMDGGQSRVF